MPRPSALDLPDRPPGEAERLASLQALQVLDTLPEERFDRITRVAASLYGVPMALITLVDAQRVWIKSGVGLEGHTLHPEAFCRETVHRRAPLVISDTRHSAMHARHPMVIGAPHVGFYAGHPIRALDEAVLGTLCLMDRRTRPFSDGEAAALADLAALVEHELHAVRIQQALAIEKESESRLRAIMDSVAEGIFTFDEWGTIESFNPAAEQLFGLPAAAVIGTHVSALVPAPLQRGMTGPLSLMVKHVPIGQCQERLGRRHDGGTFPMELTISDMRLDDKRMFIAACRDISPRKQAEAEIARRTQELEEANRHLQELDRLKSDFVNAASHELRTPLTSIVGFAEFLEDGIGGALSEQQQRFVTQIQDGARRLQRLVDDLLDFARMEAGTFNLVIQATDLRLVVDEELKSLLPQAHDAALTLTAEMPDEPLPVRVDSRRVGQVLLNLVGNAIKFTPEGGSVTVRVLREHGQVRIEVADTGRGIAPEAQRRLFEKFYQVDASSTRTCGGTGLGLSIAKALVEAHGGDIGVVSAPEQGATFWFTIPCARLQSLPPPRGKN